MAHIITYANQTGGYNRTMGESYPNGSSELRGGAAQVKPFRYEALSATTEHKPEMTLADEISFQTGPMHPAKYDVQGEIVMCTGKSLLGQKVIGHNDGIELGYVSDLIFDHENNQLSALVLSQKNVFDLSEAQIVPWREICELGIDAIVVESMASKMRLHDDESLSLASRKAGALLLSRSRILTDEGESSHALGDMCIDELSGDVLGYQSEGEFIDVTLHGKRFVSAPPRFDTD